MTLRRGNVGNLRAAAARKHAAAVARAENGLQEMLRTGAPITFRGVTRAAGVSLEFLYNNPDLRSRVESLRGQQQTLRQAPPAAPDPGQPSSVIRSLTAQLAEIKCRHRDEVSQLRRALEAAHGENLQLRRRLGHLAAEPAPPPGGKAGVSADR